MSAVVDEGSMRRLHFGRDDVTGAEVISVLEQQVQG